MLLLHEPRDLEQVVRWAHLFTLCSEPGREPVGGEFYLRFIDGQLSLCRSGDGQGVIVQNRDVGARIRGKLALAQACGDAAGGARTVLDATAGLGSDLLVLHERGYRLVGLECNPVVYAMLDSYLVSRHLEDVDLLLADACEYLQALERGSFEVVYLDPMFPQRGKKALPGKPMQYLRQLLSEEVTDVSALLDCARHAARDRVVLKRRLRDPLLAKPDWQVKGTSVRYDVYRPLH